MMSADETHVIETQLPRVHNDLCCWLQTMIMHCSVHSCDVVGIYLSGAEAVYGAPLFSEGHTIYGVPVEIMPELKESAIVTPLRTYRFKLLIKPHVTFDWRAEQANAWRRKR